MAGQTFRVSPELMAAQARLNEIRQKYGAERSTSVSSFVSGDHGRFPPTPSFTNSPKSIRTKLAELPPHLGWESAAVTAVLRAIPSQTPTLKPNFPINPTSHITNVEAAVETRQPDPTAVIKLYPDLALGMLREGQVAAGRVWLLLRWLDRRGAGWIEETQVKETLCRKQSDLHVCGWRQMRNLLAQGEGSFWRRNNGRLWLSSTAKVALALNVERLVLKPVAVQAQTLSGRIGLVRAHLYASFHSSRQTQKDAHPKPIARATLNDLCHVTPKTQRSYEKLAKVKTQTNFSVGAAQSPEDIEEAGWQKGNACFFLVDHKGKQGKPGRGYVAWQIPNSYFGPHALMPPGRQKRINRELADLFMKGMTGNGQEKVDRRFCLVRRYFRNGRLAAKAFNRSTGASELYWRSSQHDQTAHPRIWHTLA